MGERNKTGLAYLGHYNTWLEHEIVRIQADISWTSKPPIGTSGLSTNSLAFLPTEEQFGITSIPGEVRISCNFSGSQCETPHAEDSPSLSHVYPTQLSFSKLRGRHKDVYSYLALAQQVQYAVTPVHTKDEFELFKKALELGGPFCSPRGLPNFERMAAWWSLQANGRSIFYKLPEYLAAYHKTWLNHKHASHTMIASREQRRPNETRICGKRHIAQVLDPAPQSHPALSYQNSSIEAASLDLMMDTEILSPVPEIEHLTIAGSHQETVAESLSLPETQNVHFGSVGSSSSDLRNNSKFIMWREGGGIKDTRKPRRCMICVKAGQEGYNCPGRNDRSKCPLIP